MYLAFTWENQKFRMENQMVLPILFRKRQEIWAMIQDDAFFLLFLVCSADLDILCSGFHRVQFYNFIFMNKIFTRVGV